MTVAQSDEHQRRWSEQGWDHAIAKGNYDPTREHLNFEIRNGKVQPVDKSKSIPELFKENIAARGIKDPNEGLDEPKYRTIVNLVFSGSHERMKELAFGDQELKLKHGSDNSHLKRCSDIEKWAMDVYDFVSGKYGRENIVAFIVHLDEKSPHVHCTVVPVDEKNRISFRKVCIGPENTKFAFHKATERLHDEFAVVSNKWDMERGTSIKETGAKHRSTEEYMRHLQEVCFTLQQEAEQHRKVIHDLNAEIKLAKTRVKGLTTMVTNSENKLSSVEREISVVQQKLDSKTGDELELQARIRTLRTRKSELEDELNDKTKKLQVANEKLAKLQQDYDSISEKLEELKEAISKNSFTAEERARYSILREVLNTSLIDFRRQVQLHPSEMQTFFNESLLMDMAEHSNDIMTCAMLLYLEMVDQATQVAKSHGGGGGGASKKGWGRDPKEDDREWARRCLGMAGRMMKPARKIKR